MIFRTHFVVSRPIQRAAHGFWFLVEHVHKTCPELVLNVVKDLRRTVTRFVQVWVESMENGEKYAERGAIGASKV
ncbi:hypothetical protein ACFLV7_05765 [Chloroflexota bacterium]